MVLEVCDRASSNGNNAKEAVRALRREFKYVVFFPLSDDFAFTSAGGMVNHRHSYQLLEYVFLHI